MNLINQFLKIIGLQKNSRPVGDITAYRYLLPPGTMALVRECNFSDDGLTYTENPLLALIEQQKKSEKTNPKRQKTRKS